MEEKSCVSAKKSQKRNLNSGGLATLEAMSSSPQTSIESECANIR